MVIKEAENNQSSYPILQRNHHLRQTGRLTDGQTSYDSCHLQVV